MLCTVKYDFVALIHFCQGLEHLNKSTAQILTSICWIDDNVLNVSADGKTPSELSLDDEGTRADYCLPLRVLNDHNFMHVLQTGEHLVIALCELLFGNLIDCGQALESVTISFLVISFLQPAESELLVTRLL